MIALVFADEYLQSPAGATAPHRHAWAQLEWIESGRALLLAAGREWALDAGQAVLIAPGVPHGWRMLTATRGLTFKFDGYQGLGVVCSPVWSDPWLRALPRRVLDAWVSRHEPLRATAHLLLALLVATAVVAPLPAPSLDARWAELVEEIDRAAGAPLRLDEMARRVHLSPAHFRRLFEARLGSSPGHYQFEKRMERASGLLRYTNLAVKQISAQVGYVETSAFSKAFVRHFGCRPTRLRESDVPGLTGEPLTAFHTRSSVV